MDSLDLYRSKRDFAQTPEPASSEGAPPEGPLRFVIQKHDATRLHYDLRLEWGGTLKSWAVPKGPSLNPDDRRLAVLTEDHPTLYLDFEEVIPKGQYGAGPMIIWDAGVYAPDEQGPPPWQDRAEAERQMRADFENGKLSITLRGRKLRGSFALVRTTKGDDQWLMLKHRDGTESTRDVLLEDRSVKSGRTIEQLEQGLSPEAIWGEVLAGITGARLREIPPTLAPMLPTETHKAFRSDKWTFETKLDGIRVLALVRREGTKLLSRNGRDITDRFPAVARDLHEVLPVPAVLDGEIILNDEGGRPNFSLLMQRFQIGDAREIRRWDGQRPVTFYAFDLLHLAGYDLRKAAWSDRRRLLEQVNPVWGTVRLLDTYPEVGDVLFEHIKALGLEGIVAKKLTSTYQDGERTHDWLKIKQSHSAEFFVVGLSQGSGARRSTFGSMILAQRRDDQYHFVGAVGTGFTDDMLGEALRLAEPLATERSVLADTTKVREDMNESEFRAIRWLRPDLVAEVRYGDWIEGKLRFPVFVRFRFDLSEVAPEPTPSSPVASDESLADSVAEQLGDGGARRRDEMDLRVLGERVRLTNLGRIFWPGGDGLPEVTKRDLVTYLARVAPTMLTHLRDRPLSIVRCPSGIGGERFFQKHWDAGFPDFVPRIPIWSDHNGRAVDFLLCQDAPTLLWLGQMAALEIHPWYSRIVPDADHGADFSTSPATLDASALSFPDFIVVDLDPYLPDDMENDAEARFDAWKEAVEVGFGFRDLLATLNLRGYPKTSGKSGLHVYIPIARTLDYDVVRALCETMGRFLMAAMPAKVTLEWTVKKRPQRVFFDHNQNVRGKTLVAAYSPRLVPGAPVSTPLRWEELDQVNPISLNVFSVPERLQSIGDPWAGILEDRQRLSFS